MTHTAALQLKGLDKRYGALHVTQDVSLEVRTGEIHALIGPNGAGKTTLMAQIAGQLKPDAGQVLIQGQDVTHWSAQRRARAGLARTFQTGSVFRSLTTHENVAIALNAKAGRASLWRPFRRPETLKQADETLQRFGLHEEQSAASLGYGTLRQLELAMGLATTPSILLLDEPLAGLSHTESAQAVYLLAGLRHSFPMLLIEHDMQAVFALADRISVLVGGKIIASGTPDEIRASHEVKQAYLGDA
ncbi:ABC transporter ATP-binding protein [Pusillimonas sp. CC-YST705]|uniref:ABC transporter ATP-binding protein n=1 Tax=Mesopusillimonas faecipullorum TaxID=2755040 RepID=A0ABS8CFP2_9BURK|nr:ABC transporter ATP-binding protein [Mesopusillimonas faecipullorum]MCB5364866.1 ABC transporter ATP-binding protein [Mesopusillimonas faecipullorum]